MKSYQNRCWEEGEGKKLGFCDNDKEKSDLFTGVCVCVCGIVVNTHTHTHTWNEFNIYPQNHETFPAIF